MIAEQKSKYDDDKQGWIPMLSPIFKDKMFRPDETLTQYNCPYSFQPYDYRNYEVFSVLANVRNGYDIKPISNPRDYPDDMHEVSKWLLDGWDFVDHSPTWLSLDEVFLYDWKATPSNYHPGGTLEDSAKDFLENMNTLAAYAQSENVEIRLLFGFDN